MVRVVMLALRIYLENNESYLLGLLTIRATKFVDNLNPFQVAFKGVAPNITTVI